MQARTGAAVAVAAVGAVAAAFTAGCGGGGGGKTYSPTATAACLRSKGASIDRVHTSFVAEAHHGYRVSGLADGGAVALSFGNASELRDATRPERFLLQIDLTGNVALEWYTFSPAADREVKACLR